MQDAIKQIFQDGLELRQTILKDSALLQGIEKATQVIIKAIRNGGTIYCCGNGGSACDAMHLAEELVARYKRERPGIRAMHLMDAGTLTCWSNDYEFASVFERQVQTFCGPDDVLMVFSTSGNSQNVLNAVQAAKLTKTKTIGLLGKGGGKLKDLCDHSLVIPSDATERIQEVHITLVHIFCEMIETQRE